MTSKNESESLNLQKDPQEIQHNNSLLNKDNNTSNSIIENEDIVTPTSSHKSTHIQPIQSIIQQIRTNFNDYIISEYLVCLICDQSYESENMLINKECKHFVCTRCAKFFYEEKIEQGESNITCPKFSCKTKISTYVLQSLVSSMHFKKFTKLQSNKCNSNKELSEYQLQTDQIKIYIQPHVIDINNNEMFYLYHNKKSQICTKCGENALFTKSGSHKIKCLNCGNSICRYCFKEFTFNHMNLDSEDHCKIYFKKPGQDQKNEISCCKNYLTELFFTIASFFMVFIGYYMWLYRCMGKVFSKEKGCCCYIVIIIITIIFFLLGFPFILMSFPYFSIFLAITL